MIEWQEHSTASERMRLADEIDYAQEAVYAAIRDEAAAQKKLSRQRKPENVLKATRQIDVATERLHQAHKLHESAVRLMCNVHVDFNLDDLVELIDVAGGRKREPIVVEKIEFNRNADGSFWLRIKGILLRESTDGRPLLTQGFDLLEHDTGTRLLKHN
jgi:hypothetical protein